MRWIFLLFLCACSTAEITDFEACPVELPYSHDGYCTRVVSQTHRSIPKDEWAKERRTMICLPHESYAQLKNSLYKMCYDNKCKQALDTIGDMFQQMDDLVKQLDGVIK